MQRLEGIHDLGKLDGPVHLAVGVFDGVHLGHQAVIRSAQEHAGATGLAVAATFTPHPAGVLNPSRQLDLLTPLDHKLELLAESNLVATLVIPFNKTFAATPAKAFLEQLAAACDLREIIVGEGWTFGKNRTGTMDLIQREGQALGLTGYEVPPVSLQGSRISSSRIREALAVGQLDVVKSLLGRRFDIVGQVQRNRQLGRSLGFPTANTHLDQQATPPFGVYAVWCEHPWGTSPAVANIGIRPTVDDTAELPQLEVHIPDFDQDLYGRRIKVLFEKHIRPEVKFKSLADLKRQIANDTREALMHLKDANN